MVFLQHELLIGGEMVASKLKRRPAGGRLNFKSLVVSYSTCTFSACQPFRAFDDVERNRLAFFQAPETIRLNGGKMHENIFTVFPREKAVTLCVIEPLYCSLFHV